MGGVETRAQSGIPAPALVRSRPQVALCLVACEECSGRGCAALAPRLSWNLRTALILQLLQHPQRQPSCLGPGNSGRGGDGGVHLQSLPPSSPAGHRGDP